MDDLERYRRILESMMNVYDSKPRGFMFFNTNGEEIDPMSFKKPELDYELIEDDKTARFVFELAGIEKDEINVDIVDDMLIVKCDNPKKSVEYKIALKQPFENPSATYKNGILEIVFKKTQKKSTKIKIE